MDTSPPPPLGRHRAAVVLVALIIGLISAGALVTSKGAGLSVPDWPTSYGSFNPPNWWRISTVRSEHGHRLFAGMVALLSIGLAVWTSRSEPRQWVRRLSQLAVAAVLFQALLGGITVLFFLPTAISVAHAALAELFLALIVALAVATGGGWWSGVRVDGDYGRLSRLAVAGAAAVYLQILLGAVMRHSGAGLAIPDVPLVFGGLVPPRWTPEIAIHYCHRLGAVAVAVVLSVLVVRVFRGFRGDPRLTMPAATVSVLLPVQITLGLLVVASQRMEIPNTVHVATGAALWASTVVLALFAYRLRWLSSQSAAGPATNR